MPKKLKLTGHINQIGLYQLVVVKTAIVSSIHFPNFHYLEIVVARNGAENAATATLMFLYLTINIDTIVKWRPKVNMLRVKPLNIGIG